MVEAVIAAKTNAPAADRLLAELQKMPITGILYLGYPVIETVDDRITFDGLLISREHGVTIFDFNGEQFGRSSDIKNHQDELYNRISEIFIKYKMLTSGRGLSIPLEVITLAHKEIINDLEEGNHTYICTPETITNLLGELPGISEPHFKAAQSALQQTTTIKPARKRTSIQKINSHGAVMKEIDKAITNLDPWQNRAAIETPEGPQRIRGLAGSGKTVVLALKAAYLHYIHPEWNIALTFNTRALYQQFRDLVRRFYFSYAKDEPDWQKLNIIHAWGGSSQRGVYSQAVAAINGYYRDFGYAKSHYGRENAFSGVCSELLPSFREGNISPVYDALLIDEAQDLPQSFFELAFYLTKDPKRIIWAYDELQNLGDYTMMPPEDLFGTNSSQVPNMTLVRNQNLPVNDVILPVCYRNNPWTLTTAHALGFGTNRAEGIVQFFDAFSLWRDIGYNTKSGNLAYEHHVVLERRSETYPEQFLKVLDKEDVIISRSFTTYNEQFEWIADEIKNEIENCELEPSDIMVIVIDSRRVNEYGAKILTHLLNRSIESHIAGVTTNQDDFHKEGSVAITGIHRAKGNEAPMVFVVNSEYGFRGLELTKKRNTLFTAITRSRAWVRICGVGENMEKLDKEVQKVKDDNFTLDFTIPPKDVLDRLKKLNRDRTDEEKSNIKQSYLGTNSMMDLLLSGDIEFSSLPKDLSGKILKVASKAEADKGTVDEAK